MNATAEGTVRVGRRRVPVTNPDKELFPDDGITKAELVDYYRAVARVILPFLRDRPLVERYPDGYGGRSFFHKDLPDYFPDWIHHRKVPKRGGQVDVAVCDNAATLAYLANQACLTPHPWLSRTDRPRPRTPALDTAYSPEPPGGGRRSLEGPGPVPPFSHQRQATARRNREGRLHQAKGVMRSCRPRRDVPRPAPCSLPTGRPTRERPA
ncbi:non-homologous end-joining DNA ligase LigD [Streptomyces mirabilis]|uniref:non-homologous end-joining DNA ligase LigD n=1 Tax=Streptomyces mirabilis TaxID=68239 RepID=UPI0036D8C66E